MSKENVKLFFEKVQEDGELQMKLNHLYEESKGSLMSDIVKLGSGNGYHFNEADMVQFERENTQREDHLDDGQLENVAGGFASPKEMRRLNPDLISIWRELCY